MDIKVLKLQNVSKQCIVCGIVNDASLRAQFLETAGGVLIGVPQAREKHQSYPDRMHGGVIAALLDEVVGRAVQIGAPDVWGVTAELQVRYLKPVPIEEQIYIAGGITRNASRLFEGKGGIYLARTGELLAYSEAKYIKLPVERIADADFLHTQWFADERPIPDISGFAFPLTFF